MKRAEAICDIQHAIDEQKEAADKLIASKEAVADCDDIRRRFNMLTISFNEDDSVASYEVNSKKADNMLLTAGFFAVRPSALTLTRYRPRPATGCAMSRRRRLLYRRDLSIRIAFGHGPRAASMGVCSYALSGSFLPHMCVICGRKTIICTTSST